MFWLNELAEAFKWFCAIGFGLTLVACVLYLSPPVIVAVLRLVGYDVARLEEKSRKYNERKQCNCEPGTCRNN